eukprot:TRINITY_DN68179_c9_g2_i3.p1 TRINITY_DN68179_c9_g2~~TRINITY_DN68179_c9_g2_i3.p1  ORF type:complete len:486 (-),score=65.86 TRINITY_DN68179_c9_g2_i3:68-1525(-)
MDNHVKVEDFDLWSRLFWNAVWSVLHSTNGKRFVDHLLTEEEPFGCERYFANVLLKWNTMLNEIHVRLQQPIFHQAAKDSPFNPAVLFHSTITVPKTYKQLTTLIDTKFVTPLKHKHISLNECEPSLTCQEGPLWVDPCPPGDWLGSPSEPDFRYLCSPYIHFHCDADWRSSCLPFTSPWFSWWPNCGRPSGRTKIYDFSAISKETIIPDHVCSWTQLRATIQFLIDKFEDIDLDEANTRIRILKLMSTCWKDQLSLADEFLQSGDMILVAEDGDIGLYHVFGWERDNFMLFSGGVAGDLDWTMCLVPPVSSWNARFGYWDMYEQRIISAAFLPLCVPEIKETMPLEYQGKNVGVLYDGNDGDPQWGYDSSDGEEDDEKEIGDDLCCTWLLSKRLNDVFARIVLTLSSGGRSAVLPPDVHRVIAGFIIPELPRELLIKFPPSKMLKDENYKQLLELCQFCLYGTPKPQLKHTVPLHTLEGCWWPR